MLLSNLLILFDRPPLRNAKSPTGNKVINSADIKSPLSPGKSMGHQRSKSDATGKCMTDILNSLNLHEYKRKGIIVTLHSYEGLLYHNL